MPSTSLPLLPAPLWSRVVVPFMGQIDLYADYFLNLKPLVYYLLMACLKSDFPLNCTIIKRLYHMLILSYETFPWRFYQYGNKSFLDNPQGTVSNHSLFIYIVGK